jgi:hypothetical protein
MVLPCSNHDNKNNNAYKLSIPPRVVNLMASNEFEYMDSNCSIPIIENAELKGGKKIKRCIEKM